MSYCPICSTDPCTCGYETDKSIRDIAERNRLLEERVKMLEAKLQVIIDTMIKLPLVFRK